MPVNPEVLQALTAGIQAEIASYVFYLEASKKRETDKVGEILRKLAIEEKEHFQVLERQYDSLVRSEMWISTSDILKQDGLPEIDEAMSAEHQALIDEVGGTNSLNEILDIAYRLEEEAYEMFSHSAQYLQSDEAKKIFRELAKFEEGHMALIDEMRKEYL